MIFSYVYIMNSILFSADFIWEREREIQVLGFSLIIAVFMYDYFSGIFLNVIAVCIKALY